MNRRHVPGSTAELLGVALPMVVSQGCETLMMFVDRLFLSRLGPAHMSAAMGGGLTCFMFMTFFVGLTGYANALVAQHLGAGRTRRCPAVVTQALIISCLAYPILVSALPLGHWLFGAMGIDARQLELQRAYFDILVLGSVIGLTRNCLGSFFSGVGRTRVVMVSAATAMVVNVAANYVLIFGALGFPAMGIRGAALGTLAGSFAGLTVLACRYFGRRCRADYGVLRGLRYDRALMGKLLRLGSPSGLELFLNLLAFDLLVLNFHSYGIAVAAAITITFNWDMVSFIPLIGVNIAVTSLVGRHMGARAPETAHRTTLSGLKLACAYSAGTFAVFSLFPEPLVSVFGPPGGGSELAEVLPLAVSMVRLISVYVFADAVGIVFGGALRGAGDTFWTMCISVSGHWILTLAAAVLIRVFRTSPLATWRTVVVLVLGIGVTFYVRYRSGRWRLMRVVDERPSPLKEDVEIHV